MTKQEKIRLVFISQKFSFGKPPNGLTNAGFHAWVDESNDAYNEWKAVPLRKIMAFASELASLGRLEKVSYSADESDMFGKWLETPEPYCVRGCAELVVNSRDSVWFVCLGAYMFAHGLNGWELEMKKQERPLRNRLDEVARLLSCAVEYSKREEGDEGWSEPKYWAFDGSRVENANDFAEAVESSAPAAAIKRAAGGLN